MFGESIISMFSLWTSMNSWLTPTVLFLLLNLVIGTIAVTSGFASKPTSDHHSLSRSPSVLHRLRSIKMYRSPLHPPPEPVFYHAAPEENAAPEERDPAGEVVHEEEAAAEEDDDGEGPTMEEVFSRIQQGNAAFGRSKSDRGHLPEPKKVNRRIIKKAASDMASVLGGFEAVPEMEPTAEQIRKWAGPDDEVDGKAEDFINRFRQQLNQQRQDSIFGAGTGA